MISISPFFEAQFEDFSCSTPPPRFFLGPGNSSVRMMRRPNRELPAKAATPPERFVFVRSFVPSFVCVCVFHMLNSIQKQ